MQLEEVQGTSKKTGKQYKAYRIKIGEFTTPLFFPSRIEEMYIKNFLRRKAHLDFNNEESDNEESEADD